MKPLITLLLTVLLAFGNFATAVAQNAAPAPAGAPAPTTAAPGAAPSTQVQDTTSKSSKSIWEYLKMGGPVMILIAICSIAMVYLIVDGVMRCTNTKKAIPV